MNFEASEDLPAAKRVRRRRERVFLFAKYAQRITDCQRKGVSSIIECGRLLIAAKDELKHGEFLKMIENNLPFKRSTAQALMKVANDKRITNNQRSGCLPAHFSLRWPRSASSSGGSDGKEGAR